MTSKATRLRQRLEAPGVVRLAGAHNGLSARLVERAGFDGVWASGFEISTSYAMPDASILTMTEYLATARAIDDAVDLPVVADCDTGFGDVTNVAHMVRQYERAGVAAVCIEDKPFPKVNSFVGDRQRLASVEDFTEKLRVAKTTQAGDAFMVIARTEAFIAGFSHDEALDRAEAYVDAGADAVLVHSKAKTADEILGFAHAWTRRVPLVIVPTTYFQITAEQIERAGIKVVIYANHGIRAAARRMDEVLRQIVASGSTAPVEDEIATMGELFTLQGMDAVTSRRS